MKYLDKKTLLRGSLFCFFFVFRVKKEFEGVAVVGPAASTASTAAPTANLSTIQDEATAESGLEQSQQPQPAHPAPSDESVLTAAAAGPELAAAASALTASAAETACITETETDQAKLEASRKISRGSMSMSAEVNDCDMDDENFTPHFQRVYISGDDNTGVRID